MAIGWMKIFPGGNLLCGNFSGDNFPGGSFPGWELSRWEFSGWEFSWVGVVREGSFQVRVFLGGSYPGGSFPGWNCPGETYPGWEFFLVEVFRVGIVRWESSGWQFFEWEFSCYPILHIWFRLKFDFRKLSTFNLQRKTFDITTYFN